MHKLTRPERLIIIHIKEYIYRPPLWKRSKVFIFTFTFYRPSRVGCAQAYKYYGRPGHIEHRKCDETRHPDICSFKDTNSGIHRLLCNAEVCGSSNITIGSVNAAMGKVTDWIPTSKEVITGTVQEAMKTNQKKRLWLSVHKVWGYSSVTHLSTDPKERRKWQRQKQHKC